MTKKRKLKREVRSALIIGVLLLMIIGVFSLMTTNFAFVGKRSIHSDAKKYKTSHCLAFYPDSTEGKKLAKQICKDHSDDKEDHIYDYSLIPYGDYYLVSYGSGYQFFSDKEYKPFSVGEVSEEGTHIIGDYLKYTFKKDRPEKYYNSKFIKELKYENVDFSNVTYDIDGENLVCSFNEYDLDVLVPLKYMQTHINMNFGYPNEDYKKPIYIDDEHPIIALTFDDGPQFYYDPGTTSSEQIVDTLYEYDATATFFIVGEMLEERDAWTDYEAQAFLKKSIERGNEYGSHTQDHAYYLTDWSTAAQIKDAISGPGNTLSNMTGYQMKTYRPTGGFFSDEVTAASPYAAILWDIDSTDWDLRDSDAIYEKIKDVIDRKILETGDVILFHDIYFETADAIEKLVPEFIDHGYQLVTVSEMLECMGIDVTTLKYYYGPTYYE